MAILIRLLAVLGFALTCTFTQAQERWQTLGNGLDNRPAAYALHEGKLYVAVLINYDTGALYRFNQNQWELVSPLKTLQHFLIDDLISFRGELYLSGYFEHINNISNTKCIAKWNGKTWQSVGGSLQVGILPRIMDLHIHQNELIATGSFLQLGQTNCKNIARWDGKNWKAIGNGLNKSGIKLATYQNNLIVGGAFDSVENIQAKRIAQWNGKNWKPLAQGLENPGENYQEVRDLTIHNNRLVALGNFTQSGNLSTLFLAEWDGRHWYKIPIDAKTKEINLERVLSYNNQLIVAGSNPGELTNNIRTLKSGYWKPLGNQLYGNITLIFTFDQQLIAGGTFYHSEHDSVKHIAALSNYTHIFEKHSTPTLKIYNSSNQLNIESTSDNPIQAIKLYTLEGKLAYQQSFRYTHQLNILLPDHTTSVLIAEVSTLKQVLVKKIIIL